MRPILYLRIEARRILDDVNFVAHKIARRLVRKIFEIVFTDMFLLGYLNDPFGSVAFEKQHLMDVPVFRSRPKLFQYLLDRKCSEDGLFLEFGVYKGNSINRLASIKPNTIFYGFDSFVGLPEHWSTGARKGAFSVNGKLPAVHRNVRLISGFFEDTLPKFIASQPGSTISFIHVDCDLYSSTKTILTLTRPLLKSGAIILFDEFFNGPGWQHDEFGAFREFVEETGLKFEYIGYVQHGSQVAVRIL